MIVDYIPFRDARYFSSFICDYIDQIPSVKELYHRYPKVENFKLQIDEKGATFSAQHRNVLASSLNHQYQNSSISNSTSENIKLLKEEKTFTVTTGHQLNLFTGPLYFLYKIISTINLCKTLKKDNPAYNFVPMYWMATEDHDFEEINYFNLKGKKIHWNRNDGGAVGTFKTDGLDKVFEIFSSEIGKGKNAEELKTLFKKAYLEHENLADATRWLANELFGSYGLVIIDGNDKDLKKLFVPYIKNEIIDNVLHTEITRTNEKIVAKGYKVQVNPRELNLFYLADGRRERILENEGAYVVNNTTFSWSKEELLEHIDKFPEYFSPNVVMRPLYQEVVLPNLCYIGGGGELAYWLQLKEGFHKMEVTFPILLPRNSVLIQSNELVKKLNKLGVSDTSLFLNQHELINHKVREISDIDIDFSPQITFLKKQFEDLHQIAKETDQSFENAVKAQEKKQIDGLQKLEKRLLKAQKRKLSDQVSRIVVIQNMLFPQQSLQERTLNFSEMFLEYGDELITTLIKHLDPLKMEFIVVKN